MVDFFTSDSHLSHFNVIRYDNRPFSSIEEHDETLIQNWNAVVRRNDIVYHCGDFMFGGREKQEQVIKKLNGRIRLIKGNHDLKKSPNGFEWVKDIAVVKVEGKKICLCHYPLASPPRCDYHLFGHSHINGPHRYINYSPEFRLPAYNMYVGFWNWRPVTLEQILEVKINKVLRIEDIQE